MIIKKNSDGIDRTDPLILVGIIGIFGQICNDSVPIWEKGPYFTRVLWTVNYEIPESVK